MDTCDVLVVGGGPAGSTCAEALHNKAGLDVLLLDKAPFPRDKPCAGWIPPRALRTLEVDPEEYRRERVLQEIRNFSTGLVDGPEIETRYNQPVSYGILRKEFDQYLLQRSSVRWLPGTPVSTIERQNGGWLVNGQIAARLLIGAGGHFCPVARFLGAQIGTENAIIAQVTEWPLSPDQARECLIPADTPALYFCRDMKGYGWCFRKGEYLNAGLGRLDRNDFGRHVREFCTFIEKRWNLEAGISDRLQGHAYLLHERHGGRTLTGDGVLLIGDAAGLAHPVSGDGILPAIESALLAADTIIAAHGDYQQWKLAPYTEKLAARLEHKPSGVAASPFVSGISRFLGARLLSSSWFVRHVVINRWFLHAHNKHLDTGVTRKYPDAGKRMLGSD